MSLAASWPRRLRWPALAALLAGLVVADRSGWLLARVPDDMAVFDGAEVRVARVIDGDTIEVEARDPRNGRPATHVRLWGIDCPERPGPRRPAGEPFAEQARALARSLAGGERVLLRLEPHRTRDAHGRLLAHVQLPDGSSLNEALLEAGLARADERWPHALLARYAQVEQSARRAGVGVWSIPDNVDE